ncbi:hypothetical protein F4820DRAFT_321769 [Hypoxylon rubiginosum]|uniref:Uncharacterized protein n=1 Tax=Hypoxylon rubiginosum TaxID=110542 RepID=A0ACB9ZFG9_9PEZI|nr:hypothetical protein F4820DRAFT_321769 [Hypoxylon rubiginosum]
MHYIGQCPQSETRKLPRVVVFSDSSVAISLFYNVYHARPTIRETPRELLTPIHKLIGLGSHVEVRWVPGHVSVEGNERADTLANFGATYAIPVPLGSLGSEEGLLPLLTFSRAREPVKICPIYSGRPFTDIMIWRRKDMRRMLERLTAPHNERYSSTVEVRYSNILSKEQTN